MKRVFISSVIAFGAFCLVSCDGSKTNGEASPPDSSKEQAVPKSPGQELLAVMLVIQDQDSANSNAAKVKEMAASLPKDMPHDDAVNLMNEMLRFASKECYGSLALEAALKDIRFDAEEYNGSAPLDVEGYEPTPDQPQPNK